MAGMPARVQSTVQVERIGAKHDSLGRLALLAADALKDALLHALGEEVDDTALPLSPRAADALHHAHAGARRVVVDDEVNLADVEALLADARRDKRVVLWVANGDDGSGWWVAASRRREESRNAP